MKLSTSFGFAVLLGAASSSFSAESTPNSACTTAGGRAVDFSTTQGSLLNLDISPDGKWLVFDMLGDIFVVSSSGGEAVELTSGNGWDSRPVWSPDGKSIAFISDRDGDEHVFIVESHTGNGLRRVTNGKGLLGERVLAVEGELRTAEWLPDSTHVLVGNNSYSTQGPETSDAFKKYGLLADLNYGTSAGLYYFKRADTAVDASRTSDSARSAAYEMWKIEGGDTPRRAAGQVVHFMSGWEAPAVSPDGRWVVYRDRSPLERLSVPDSPRDEKEVDTVRVYDQRRGTARVLISPLKSPGWRSNGGDGKQTGFSANTRYAISPDSRYLYISYGGSIHRIEIETGENDEIKVLAHVSQCLEPMTSNKLSAGGNRFQVRNTRSATSSPDESSIVFSALRRLYVLNTGNHTAHQLSVGEGVFEPSFSPDGKWISYVSWNDVEGGHVWRSRADGSHPQRLTTEPGYYESPTWSPDGTKLAFVGSNELSDPRAGFDSHLYGGNLRVFDLERGSSTVLPQKAILGTALSFSSDSKRLSYSPFFGEIGERKALFAVAVGGGAPSDYSVDSFFEDSKLVSAAMNPNGSVMALVKFGDIYIVTCGSLNSDRIGFDSGKCRERKLTRVGGNDPHWQDNGAVLEWSFAHTYYRAKLEDLLREYDQETSDGALADGLEIRGRLQSIDLDLTVARDRAAGAIALVGARIISMHGETVLENGAMVVRAGRIEAIGPAAATPIPEDAEIVDVSGKTLIPGLIDAHAHFNQLPRDLLAGNHWEPLASLAYGITTIRNPSNGGDHAFAYAELIETGQMVGPRMFSTPGMVSDRVGKIKSVQDAINFAERTQQLGGTFLKYHTGFNRQQRRWIYEAARIRGMSVASHLPGANYTTGMNLSTIYDGTSTSEHEITDSSSLFSDVDQFLVGSGVWVCFTPLASSGGYPSKYWSSIRNDIRMHRFFLGNEPKEEKDVIYRISAATLVPLNQGAEENAKFIARVENRGGHIMIGSHGDYTGIGMHLEMWAHVRGGMTPHQVLMAATIGSATGMGLDADVGSIEVGKLADVLILNLNPLDDIRNTLSIELVMKDGVLRESDSLSEVWPASRVLPEWDMKRDASAGPRASAVMSHTH